METHFEFIMCDMCILDTKIIRLNRNLTDTHSHTHTHLHTFENNELIV